MSQNDNPFHSEPPSRRRLSVSTEMLQAAVEALRNQMAVSDVKLASLEASNARLEERLRIVETDLAEIKGSRLAWAAAGPLILTVIGIIYQLNAN